MSEDNKEQPPKPDKAAKLPRDEGSKFQRSLEQIGRTLLKTAGPVEYINFPTGMLIELMGKQLLKQSEYKEPVPDVKKRLDDALHTMQETADYLEQLRTHLLAQQKEVEEAQKSYERYQHMAATEKEKAKALLDEMETRISAGAKGERKAAFWLGVLGNLLVFLLGIVLSDWLTAKWVLLKASLTSGQ